MVIRPWFQLKAAVVVTARST